MHLMGGSLHNQAHGRAESEAVRRMSWQAKEVVARHTYGPECTANAPLEPRHSRLISAGGPPYFDTSSLSEETKRAHRSVSVILYCAPAPRGVCATALSGGAKMIRG